MTAYKVFPGDGRKFVTDKPADLAFAPVGSLIRVVEMTPEEYAAVPATSLSAVFFSHGTEKEKA